MVLPNVAVPEKKPVTTAEPSGRAAMSRALTKLKFVPPALATQMNVPFSLSLATNASEEPPLLVNVRFPNVAAPDRPPVTTTEPS